MATTKEVKEVKEYDPFERVDIFIERPASSQDEQNLHVGFNGKNYILPKGKTSSVPRCVYDEIMRARKAQEHYDDTVRELLTKAQAPVL